MKGVILVFLFLGCASEPYSFFIRKHPCRIESFSSVEIRDGQEEIEQRDYRWSDRRVEYQGLLSEGYTSYNEYGFFTESYRLQYDEGDRTHRQFYDCTEEWCWRTKRSAEYYREGRESSVDVRYEWDGKTEFFYQTDGSSGYTVHNDHARAEEWYYEHEFGYQEETYAYDCDAGWCKLLRIEGSGFYDDAMRLRDVQSIGAVRDVLLDWLGDGTEETTFVQEYSWSGNRQEWSNEYGDGYTVYNDYGYVIERFVDHSSWEKQEEYGWTCADE